MSSGYIVARTTRGSKTGKEEFLFLTQKEFKAAKKRADKSFKDVTSRSRNSSKKTKK